MKILFLTTHLNTGGITSYLLTLAQGLREKGCEVFIISSGGDQEESFRQMGVTITNLSIKTKSEVSPKIYWALWAVRRLIVEQGIDVIHSHTRITQVMGSFLSRMTRCSHVTTCHGFFRPRWFRRMFPCWGDAAIAISPPVQQHLVNDFGMDERRVFEIINGVDLEIFTLRKAGEKEEVRQQYDMPHGPVLGIIARLSDVKGHDVLIRAMPKVITERPQVQLAIVGTGKMEPELKRLVQELGLNQSVHFLPVVNQTREILPLFDLFVLPSLSEGLGLSAIEAQAVGLPVIASRVGGLPHLIDDEKTGLLVEPGNVPALAAAILRLLNDPEQGQRIAQQAREKVVRDFSASQMTESTLAVYQHVTGEKSS